MNIDRVQQHTWDLLVMGAGPAGAIAAHQAARGGMRVLLVDRRRFPRNKVCGCCLNGAALDVLEESGLGDLVEELGGRPLKEVRLYCGRQSATLPLPRGASVSRTALDSALVREAKDAGATFLDGCSAVMLDAGDDSRHVRLTPVGCGSFQVQARLVIVASGLGARCLPAGRQDPRDVTRRARIGAGTVISPKRALVPPGILAMACHRHGYAGVVQLEDGRSDVAAALDVQAVREHSVGLLIAEILESVGFDAREALADAEWSTTARLTQHRRCVFGERYLVVGDAAGYVEPFTGEGIAWALASGRAVVPFAARALDSGTEEAGPAWGRQHADLISGRMRRCRAICGTLRRPWLTGAAVRILEAWPAVASPFLRSLNRSF